MSSLCGRTRVYKLRLLCVFVFPWHGQFVCRRVGLVVCVFVYEASLVVRTSEPQCSRLSGKTRLRNDLLLHASSGTTHSFMVVMMMIMMKKIKKNMIRVHTGAYLSP